MSWLDKPVSAHNRLLIAELAAGAGVWIIANRLGMDWFAAFAVAVLTVGGLSGIVAALLEISRGGYPKE